MFFFHKKVVTTSQETVRDAHPLLSALLDCEKKDAGHIAIIKSCPGICHTLIFLMRYVITHIMYIYIYIIYILNYIYIHITCVYNIISFLVIR